MRLRAVIYLTVLSGINLYVLAQVNIAGSILDSSNKQVIAFVNIGIKNKNVGTVSKENGNFSIQIPFKNANDTLTFSMLGYRELNVPVRQIISGNNKSYFLSQKLIVLKSPEIIVSKYKECSYGLKKNPAIHFTDGSVNHDDIFEIAQVIKMDGEASKLTSLNLLIAESKADSSIFRINFYEYENGRPGKQIYKSILQKVSVNKGWLKINLSKHQIYVKGEIVVAIEFIPSAKKNDPVLYEIKLGGSSNSFVRKNSLGQWSVPPHHYRIFVTALSSSDTDITVNSDAEEKETLPAFKLFSPVVKDSFSIFVKLPETYYSNPKKKYPLVYLLDANVYYDILANLINKQNNNKQFNEIILIGIGYKDFVTMDSLRLRDYTFPQASGREQFSVSGGAQRFRDFLLKQLLPHIDKLYRTDNSNRTLMGHSLGGYFTLYALEKDVEENGNQFRNYVSASPSIHYHKHYIIKQFKNIDPLKNKNPKNVYINFGRQEADEEEGKENTFESDFNSLINVISGLNKVKIIKAVIPRAAHMETAIPGFKAGLELLHEKRE